MPTKKHWATGEFTNVLRRWLKLKNVKQGFREVKQGLRNVKAGFELNVFHCLRNGLGGAGSSLRNLCTEWFYG